MKEILNKGIYAGLAIAIATLPLVGCAHKTVSAIEPTEQTTKTADINTNGAMVAKQLPAKTTGSVNLGSTAIAVKNEGAGPVEPLDTPQPKQAALTGAQKAEFAPDSRTTLGMQPVYFDFDKSVIQPEQVKKISADAMFLKNNPQAVVRIEGNCDERGTSVYNLALGELRAIHAKNYLVNLGVADHRLTTISYGQEKPLAPGHTEKAWAENRRDDFVAEQM